MSITHEPIANVTTFSFPEVMLSLNAHGIVDNSIIGDVVDNMVSQEKRNLRSSSDLAMFGGFQPVIRETKSELPLVMPSLQTEASFMGARVNSGASLETESIFMSGALMNDAGHQSQIQSAFAEVDTASGTFLGSAIGETELGGAIENVFGKISGGGLASGLFTNGNTDLGEYMKVPGKAIIDTLNLTDTNPIIKLASVPFNLEEAAFNVFNPIADKIQPGLSRIPVTLADGVAKVTQPLQAGIGKIWKRVKGRTDPIWRFIDRVPANIPIIGMAKDYNQVNEMNKLEGFCREYLARGEVPPKECEVLAGRLGIFDTRNAEADAQKSEYEYFMKHGKRSEAASII